MVPETIVKYIQNTFKIQIFGFYEIIEKIQNIHISLIPLSKNHISFVKSRGEKVYRIRDEYAQFFL